MFNLMFETFSKHLSVFRDGNCCTGYILNAETQECDGSYYYVVICKINTSIGLHVFISSNGFYAYFQFVLLENMVQIVALVARIPCMDSCV